jgi:DNA-directed RNA polymerase specialized sigma subunit
MKCHDLTDEQVASLYIVIKPIASKFRFGYLSVEDMLQQGMLELLEAIEGGAYDPTMPLEAFAKSHVHNRLFNYKRDNFCRHEAPCLCCDSTTEHPCPKYTKWFKRNQLKMGLTQASSEGIENQIKLDIGSEASVVSSELLEAIDKGLPISLRKDYLRMKEGLSVPRKRKEAIKASIKEILHGQES